MRSGVKRVLPGGLFVAAMLYLLAPAASAAPGKCDVPLVDPLCEAGKTVAGAAGKVVTAPVQYAANGAVEMVTSWVADTAQWVLGKVITFIDHSTSPTLDAAWFTERYRFMIGLSALVLVPMLLIATIRAVINQDVGQLVRSFFVYLPAAILGTFMATLLARSLLAATDAMSASVAESVAGDVSQIFDSVGQTLSGSVGVVSPPTPSFAIFFAALLLIVGSFVVWLELLIRSAAVTVSVFFLPFILAGLVWPATARWTKRLIEILVALIMSKFVIVAVISLATAALADPGGGGFGTVMGGAALMLMAAFSPFAILKLMPMVEGAAVEHLQGIGRRPMDTVRPDGAVNQAVSVMRSKVRTQGSTGLAVAGSTPHVATAGPAGAAIAAGTAATRGAQKLAKEPGRRAERQADSSNKSDPAPSADAGTKPRTGGQISPPVRKRGRKS